MRKQLNDHRGKKASIATTFGINFVGFVGDIEDHVVTFFSREKNQGDRRYVRIDDVAMLAPIEDANTGLVSG